MGLVYPCDLSSGPVDWQTVIFRLGEHAEHERLYWLTDEQMALLWPYFPRFHGKPRGDDKRMLTGIIFVNRNGLRWRHAPMKQDFNLCWSRSIAVEQFDFEMAGPKRVSWHCQHPCD